MYTRLPWAFCVTVPLAGSLKLVTVSGSLSTSLSLERTSTVTAVSSGVVTLSSTATGGSFTGVTVTFTSAVTGVVPSVAV